MLRTYAKGQLKRGWPVRRRIPVTRWIVTEIALLSGLRVSEIASLRCGDVQWGEGGGSILVHRGKGGKTRLVKVGRPLADSLRRYLHWKEKRGESVEAQSPLLLSPHTGRSLTSRALQKMFARVMAGTGIQGHCFHHLRHTFATHLYRASGNNLRLVQRQLGHASVRTTEIYAHVLDEETERAVNRLYR